MRPRAGDPAEYEGLGVAIALFVAAVLGLIALVLLVGVTGLSRDTHRGRGATIVGQVMILALAVRVCPTLTFGLCPVSCLAVAASALAVLVLMHLATTSRRAESAA